MNTYEFIFGKTPDRLLRRHLLFWTIFSVGFYLQSIVPAPNLFLSAFISLCCFLPACILTVYANISILLPYFLQQKKYGLFVLGFLLLNLICFTCNYFFSLLYYKLTCNCPASSILPAKILGLSFVNTSHAMTIGGLALGIKFAKTWYLQQIQNRELVRQKIASELQLQKARIHPEFLVTALNNLHAKAIADSPECPGMLLKLSDILSFILYESDEEWIPLEKELNMITNLMEIEKINQDDHLNTQLLITGNPDNKLTAPLLLFPFLQNCFQIAATGKKERHKLSLQIKVEEDTIQYDLAFIRFSESNYPAFNWHPVLANARGRLELLYPNRYKLQLKEEGRGIAVLLDLPLNRTFVSKIIIPPTTTELATYESL